MINSKLARSGSAAAALLMAMTLFLGAEQVVEIPLFPPPLDKVIHFLYYGVMALLLAHATGRRWLWASVVVALLVGAADEWNQSMISGRDASIWDLVADCAGATAFVYAYWKWGLKMLSPR